jgi:hypothetical protein
MNEIGGTCGTYERQERCIQGFGGGDLSERDNLEDTDVDSSIILQDGQYTYERNTERHVREATVAVEKQ